MWLRFISDLEWQIKSWFTDYHSDVYHSDDDVDFTIIDVPNSYLHKLACDRYNITHLGRYYLFLHKVKLCKVVKIL